MIIVSNVLPIRAKRGDDGWDFEWDEDALVAAAKEGIPEEFDVVYVGSLSVDVDIMEQEVRQDASTVCDVVQGIMSAHAGYCLSL